MAVAAVAVPKGNRRAELELLGRRTVKQECGPSQRDRPPALRKHHGVSLLRQFTLIFDKSQMRFDFSHSRKRMPAAKAL